MLDRGALVFLLIGLTACFHREWASSGDPMLAFDSACLRGQLVAGSPQDRHDCQAMAEGLRSGDAAPGRLRMTAETYDNENIVALTLRGTIGPGDGARFDEALNRLASRYPDAHGVIMLDSPGGAVAEARSIAESVSASGISVLVDRGAQCRSTCFLVFAAARKKLVSPSASIGGIVPKAGDVAFLSLSALRSMGATIVASGEDL
jgi:membrane-bound ClpP family serine protease